jgi:SAM-dependent methyltransferase
MATASPERFAAPVARARAHRPGQRLAWEKVAAAVRDFSEAPSTRYYRECEIALIRRAAGPLAGKRVLKLDLWNEAFNTRILHWIRAEGAEAVGLDHSVTVSSRARSNGRREGFDTKLLRADIRELPFEEGSFDFIYTMGTIEHIDEYRDAVAECHRVLRPGGRAIIGVPDRWNIFLRPLMVEIMSRLGAYLYAPEKSFSERELRGVVEGAGFRVIERSGVLTIPGPVRMLDLFLHTRRVPTAALQRALVAPFRFAELRWPSLGRFGYLMSLTVERPA